MAEQQAFVPDFFCASRRGNEQFHFGSSNITFQPHKVSREERSRIVGLQSGGFRGCTVWFTGLSGAGKTTVAFAVERALIEIGVPAYALDGDNVRHGLCKNLSFNEKDRSENIRRVAEVAKLFADMGVVALASFISPFKRDRNAARKIHTEDGIPFFEVYVNTPLEICESRDPKNLYKQARAGKLKGFTGIDSIYEEPEDPHLILEAGVESADDCLQKVMDFLYSKGIISNEARQNHSLHGLPIRELFVDVSTKEILTLRLNDMPSVNISRIDLQWLQVLAEGWASPLYGFMRERQYLQSLHHGILLDLKRECTSEDVCSFDEFEDTYSKVLPINQSIPIVLPISSEQRELLMQDGKVANEIALAYKGIKIAVLSDGEIYCHRKEERVARTFGIMDKRHPVVDQIMQSGDWLLGGDIQVLERIKFDDGLDKYRMTPKELRNHFQKSKCDEVFVFQLRNPIHNGHALLMKDTRERLLKKNFRNPMLLLHPIGGWTKDDDVPLKVRIEQHKVVLEEAVLDPSWTVLSIFPSPMLYAGPTEVQWHARARLAAGVTTYIVGRDPAGLPHPDTGDYLYDPSHGAKILTMAPHLMSLKVIPFRVAAYDKVNCKMAFFDESRKEDFIFISGTKMRNFARKNIQPPNGFMSPKAWQIIANYYKGMKNSGDA